jgi:serine/threonine protein kinase
MAALTPVASVEALIGAIEKSGLLTADALEKVRDAASKAKEPKVLARDLVKGGLLTRWQAEQLINGYHRLMVGNYKLLDQIGTSPTGRVYLAEHAQMGRRHTLKVLARRLASNAEAVKHFLDSARNACSLDHRNVSHVYDVNQDRIGHYVVMEYIDGQTLEEVIERSGRLAPNQALDYMRQAAEGLAHAHANGVVHGDLKPANLLRDFSGTIKILEIGQTGLGAKPETEDADESVETASLAAVIFQAPELRGDGEIADVACDVYSVGSVLCFLLTGKAAKDPAAASSLLQSTTGVAAEIVAFCSRLMSEDPKQRPATMDKLLLEIAALTKQLAAAAGTKATQDTAPEPASLKEPSKEKWKKAPDAAAQKPATAKEADEPPVRAVLIPDLGPAPRPPETVEPFSIKTRGRIARRVRKTDAAAVGEAAVEDGKKPLWDPIQTPLVLAGAIGGGGVLVLGLGIIVVCLLALRQSKVPEPEAPPTTQVAAIAPAESASAKESNPETPVVVDANPANDVPASETVAAATNAAPVAATTEAKAETAASAASVAEPKATTAAPAEPKIAAVEPKAAATDPKTVAAAPVESKPSAKAAAKPPAEKKAAPADPFAGFAKTVSLPELPDSPDAPATMAIAPVELGPCMADDKMKLNISLLGGDTAIRTSRQKFELQPKPDNERSWDIVLTGGAAPANVAALDVENNKLMFHWTEEGAKQSAVAKQLCNCALALGAKKQIAALREPVIGQPLVIDIEKPNTTGKWNVGNLPLAKQVFLEITKTDGFKRIRTEPKTPPNVGEPIVVATGSSEKSTPLQFNMTTSATATTIDVRVQPKVKLEGWNDARPYRRKDLVNLQQETGQPLSKLQGELRKVKDSRPPPGPQENAKEATIERLSGDIERINRLLAQLGYVLDFANTTEGQAKIHFRVYCVAGDTKIDLLKAGDDAPPAKAK